MLLEPATVVAKAWDHIEKIGRRAAWAPEKVLITGAGPIGLLAALLATQRGDQTYVLDRVTEGRKPEMVRRLGATYFHSGDLGEAAAEADIVIECTGYVQMLLEAGPRNVRYRITCLTGVSPAGAEATVDPGLLNRNMVLQNSVAAVPEDDAGAPRRLRHRSGDRGRHQLGDLLFHHGAPLLQRV